MGTDRGEDPTDCFIATFGRTSLLPTCFGQSSVTSFHLDTRVTEKWNLAICLGGRWNGCVNIVLALLHLRFEN